MSDLELRFTRAYFFHLQKKGLQPQYDAQHTCHPRTCTFWRHPRAPFLHMCELCTKIHKCGPGKCTFEPIETPERDFVCPLTGLVVGECRATETFSDSTRTCPGESRGPIEVHQIYCNRLCDRAEKYCTQATGASFPAFVKKCLGVFMGILKLDNKIHNTVSDFEVFVLSMMYLCRNGVNTAGIPKRKEFTSLPSPKQFGKNNIRVTSFSKMTRKIIKLSQQHDLKHLTSKLNY